MCGQITLDLGNIVCADRLTLRQRGGGGDIFAIYLHSG